MLLFHCNVFEWEIEWETALTDGELTIATDVGQNNTSEQMCIKSWSVNAN